MRYIKKAWLVLLCALLISFASSGITRAAQTTDELQLIKETCPLAQSTLQQLEHSDLLIRTIRGSSYDSILSLMISLNTRLVASGNQAKNFIGLADELGDNYRETFYDRYTAYANALEATLGADCGQPQRFYNLLEDTRAKRAQLSEEIANMAELIDDYRQAVTDLRDNLNAAGSEDGE